VRMVNPGILVMILLHLVLIGRGFQQIQLINGRYSLTVEAAQPALGRL
jgi:hypothetical protein